MTFPVARDARHRVHGEVAPPHVVLDRERRVGDDLEVVPAGPGAHLLARRRELDPRRCERTKVAVARMQPHPDEPARDDEVLDPAVRLERGAQAVDVDAGDEEVGVLRVEAEQLVADRAADEVGVEAERADVVLDLLPHVLEGSDRFDLDERARGSFATSTVERAGGWSPTCFA